MRGHLAMVALLAVTACKAGEGAAPATPPSPSTSTPMAEARFTPGELAATTDDKNQIGSSGLPGVHTRVLHGDPTRPGLYSILLFVPANTTIQAHSHNDDRMATVVSGTWRFGYGDRFDTASLAVLPPGSVYAEPGTRAHNHFAQTQADPVVVHIVGYGPTDTVYVDPAHEPGRP